MNLDNLTIDEVWAIQIADIRERLALRTQHSWIATLDKDGWCILSVPDEGTPKQRVETLARLSSGSPMSDAADACFIAAAPNDIAILLAEVERLRAKDDASHREGMDRMQQAIIDLLNEHDAPLHLVARIVEMDYPEQHISQAMRESFGSNGS